MTFIDLILQKIVTLNISCGPDTIYSSGAAFDSINLPLPSSPPPKERPPAVRKKVLLKNSKKCSGETHRITCDGQGEVLPRFLSTEGLTPLFLIVISLQQLFHRSPEQQTTIWPKVTTLLAVTSTEWLT